MNNQTSTNTASPTIGHARCTGLGGFRRSQASPSLSPSPSPSPLFNGDRWPPLPNMPSSSSESLEENMHRSSPSVWRHAHGCSAAAAGQCGGATCDEKQIMHLFESFRQTETETETGTETETEINEKTNHFCLTSFFSQPNIQVLRVLCEPLRLPHSAFRREADQIEASLADAHLDKVYAEGDGQASCG